MRTSEKTEQVSASLFAVHRDLANPTKDAKGQVRGKADYRYLSLPALIDYLRPKLKDAQLFVTQELTGGDGFVECTTTVWHLSGQHVEFGPIRLPAPTSDPQQNGSASTYARRYALAAVFNLAADEDDDASSARPSEPSGRGRGGPSPSPATPKPDASTPASDTEQALGGTTLANLGEGATTDTPGAAPTGYLSKDDQRLLVMEYGSNKAAIDAYAARFGERVKRLADITYEMRDELGADRG